jgi:hypothetical protein
MRYDALPQARDLPRPNHQRPSIRPPFECVALLLQGGGALGSYQAGVYEALAEADLHPDWVAGISIGAVDSALIAGNSPVERVAKLRSFWQENDAENGNCSGSNHPAQSNVSSPPMPPYSTHSPINVICCADRISKSFAPLHSALGLRHPPPHDAYCPLHSPQLNADNVTKPRSA